MISGIPVTPGSRKKIMLEEEHRIHKYIGMYAADPASGRRVRCLEFIGVHGGQQMVGVDDIVAIS